VTNAVDDCGLAALSLDTVTGYWHAFYFGNVDGSETWSSAIKCYRKSSTDAGSTWGPQVLVSTQIYDCAWMTTCPRMYIGGGMPPVEFRSNVASIDQIMISVSRLMPRASHQLFGG
jgi:chitinase